MTASKLLIVIALVCFLIACIPFPSPVPLVPLGLVFYMASHLTP